MAQYKIKIFKITKKKIKNNKITKKIFEKKKQIKGWLSIFFFLLWGG
jgi:hypothetical protein